MRFSLVIIVIELLKAIPTVISEISLERVFGLEYLVKDRNFN